MIAGQQHSPPAVRLANQLARLPHEIALDDRPGRADVPRLLLPYRRHVVIVAQLEHLVAHRPKEAGVPRDHVWSVSNWGNVERTQRRLDGAPGQYRFLAGLPGALPCVTAMGSSIGESFRRAGVEHWLCWDQQRRREPLDEWKTPAHWVARDGPQTVFGASAEAGVPQALHRARRASRVAAAGAAGRGREARNVKN